MSDNSNSTIDRLDITVNTDTFSSLCAGAATVINKVKGWKPESIDFKLFTDGLTNRLVKCYLKENRDEALLIRVYGEKTELLIDRDVEVRNLQMMGQAGLCEPLYCAFTNGLCYGFSPGEVLDGKMVRDPDISKLIAGRLARMHRVRSSVNGMVPEANLFSMLYKFLHLIPESFSDPVKDTRYKSLVLPKSKLKEEIECLKEHFAQIESPVVFCHNDLLLKNIIYNKEKKEVTFIDYEYSDYNYQAFDIGNHFCEFSGLVNFDPQLYPGKDFQMRWLENYLEAWYYENDLSPDDITEEAIENFYKIVNKFALAAHVLWGTWALFQYAHSSLDFDYLEYAKSRLDEYFRRKEEFLSLEIKQKVSSKSNGL